jgi:organic radical activating enzyme
MKIRIFPESNYKAFFINNKTYRIALDQNKPITELRYPEFYDIAITKWCAGKCPYCYTDSDVNGYIDKTIIDKINNYFGILTENQKPFSVALGGGEPTAHPDFIDILYTFNKLGITPNYTTNGMFMDYSNYFIYNLMQITKSVCGGIALSCHAHLENYWQRAIYEFNKYNIKINLHIIISDNNSIDIFNKIYEKYKNIIHYFVLLPYENIGRAKNDNITIDYEYLIKNIPHNVNNIAFGANFYNFLLQNPNMFNLSLYDPEILTKFLDLTTMKLYYNSFSKTSLN